MPMSVLGVSVLELGPMTRQTDVRRHVRQTDVRQKHRLMPPPYGGAGIKTVNLLDIGRIHAIFILPWL